MKFLDLSSLANVSLHFSGIDTGDSIIWGSIECYSCKRAGSDKKLYRSLEKQYQTELAKSPQECLSTSPFGPLTEKSNRSMLIDLISTLNASFPDYDFETTSAEQFRKEPSVHLVINAINNTLSHRLPNFEQFKNQVWAAIDQEIDLQSCIVYSFTPDPESGPFAGDGNVWNFNYFFCNLKKLKRILLFTCRAQAKTPKDLMQRKSNVYIESDGEDYGVENEYGKPVWDFAERAYEDMDVS